MRDSDLRLLKGFKVIYGSELPGQLRSLFMLCDAQVFWKIGIDPDSMAWLVSSFSWCRLALDQRVVLSGLGLATVRV